MSNTEISIEEMIDYLCDIQSETPDEGWVADMLKYGCKGYVDRPEDEVREIYAAEKASVEKGWAEYHARQKAQENAS